MRGVLKCWHGFPVILAPSAADGGLRDDLMRRRDVVPGSRRVGPGAASGGVQVGLRNRQVLD